MRRMAKTSHPNHMLDQKEVRTMKRKEGWMERISRDLDITLEPLPGLPLVEITGDRRVLIENHRGVLQYGKDKICIKVKFGQVSVHGCGLELERMTKDGLIICGRIDGVTLLRRDNNGCL